MPESEWLGDRYEVLRTVSEGPRASVLQALDHVHDRLVALKVFEVGDADHDALLAEGRVLTSISPHPALPVVRGDFFTAAGDRYVVVMNWIDGTDLQRVLEEEGDPGLPLSDVLRDLTLVADALDHLHSHEPPIVHGDVKPANLIRTTDGRVVVVDFDIAGEHGGEVRVGTIGYVAPEVAAGEKPGPAADVFGLAATAVTLLSGELPTDERPRYRSIEPALQRHVASVLRAGLASDPARRPQSAGQLVENLHAVRRDEQPTGVVALVATEVAGASTYWSKDPDEMRAAMSRLRDVTDDVVTRAGGSVVASMNEGDHTIAVFRNPSSAALATLGLHDRVATESFPPGIAVSLRVALAIGEAILVDGAYTGAVVDSVVRLRAAAEAGTTITSEDAAEALLELVGSDISIVPLGRVVTAESPAGVSAFGITRPGAEHTARRNSRRSGGVATPSPGEDGSPARVPRRALLVDAVLHPSTLTAVTITGFAAIFLLVLSPELGMRGISLAVLIMGAVASAFCFSARYASGYSAWRTQAADERRERDREEQVRRTAEEREASRHRLELGFARASSPCARDGARVLEGLADEFAALTELVRRTRERPAIGFSSLLPDLSEETYRQGMSALSDALELLEFADGSQRRRLDDELAEVDERLQRGIFADPDEQARDEQRRASYEHLLARHDEARRRALELLYQAERCTTACAEARIEIASARAGDTHVDVDAVVQTLQSTIRRVREVQDELRRLGY